MVYSQSVADICGNNNYYSSRVKMSARESDGIAILRQMFKIFVDFVTINLSLGYLGVLSTWLL